MSQYTDPAIMNDNYIKYADPVEENLSDILRHIRRIEDSESESEDAPSNDNNVSEDVSDAKDEEIIGEGTGGNEGESEEEIVDFKPGMSFDTKENTIKGAKGYMAKNFHPFIIASSGKDRIRFVCTHGHRRKYTATESRPKQRVNYTGCKASFSMNVQSDGSWKVGTKIILDHSGHFIGPEIYSSYSFVKNLTKDDIEYVKDLHAAKAPNRKIADVLSQRTLAKNKQH